MNLELFSTTTIIPSRTKYQLRHFVIGQHATRPMQWRQLLLEIQSLSYNIRNAELDIEQKQIEIHRLLSTGDPIDSIEAERKRLGVTLTQRTLAGAELELNWLQELAEEIGAYTWEQIEEDQPAYWQTRLNRQAGLDRMAIEQGVSVGNLESMLNAGLIKQENQCVISPTT